MSALDRKFVHGLIAYAKQTLGDSAQGVRDEQREAALKCALDCLHALRQGHREAGEYEPCQMHQQAAEAYYMQKGRMLKLAMRVCTRADLENVDSGFVQ